MEEETQRQGGFDREVRVLRWRAPRARSLRFPGCEGRPGQPDGDVARAPTPRICRPSRPGDLSTSAAIKGTYFVKELAGARTDGASCGCPTTRRSRSTRIGTSGLATTPPSGSRSATVGRSPDVLVNTNTDEFHYSEGDDNISIRDDVLGEFLARILLRLGCHSPGRNR